MYTALLCFGIGALYIPVACFTHRPKVDAYIFNFELYFCQYFLWNSAGIDAK